MSKRPMNRAVYVPQDALRPGSPVRVTCGRYEGEAGVITQVFRRSGVAHSHVHVRGLPSCRYVVASVPLSCVEAVG